MPKVQIGCFGAEQRQMSIGAVEVLDEKEQIVRLTAASEYPVMRYDWHQDEYYDEILSHDPADVDLARMQDGGPILDRHHGDQIAVCERITVNTQTRKTELEIRFSKATPRAITIFQDVKDKIRKNVSVGYEKKAIVGTIEAKEAGKRRQVRFSWMPFECSFEPVPADPTVGVGRGKDDPAARLLEHNLPEPPPPAPAKPEGVTILLY